MLRFSDFECRKWVSLAEFLNCIDGCNGFNAEICLEPCNINGGTTSWYDAQDACEVNSQSLKILF